MLAYHYSKAEDLERAEKYLILAGEEALKSSASNEALHHYTQALDIYQKEYGDKADAKKVNPATAGKKNRIQLSVSLTEISCPGFLDN